MIWLQSLLGRVWPYIAAVGAAFGAVLAIRQSGKAAGRQEIRQEIMPLQQTAELIKRVAEISYCRRRLD